MKTFADFKREEEIKEQEYQKRREEMASARPDYFNFGGDGTRTVLILSRFGGDDYEIGKDALFYDVIKPFPNDVTNNEGKKIWFELPILDESLLEAGNDVNPYINMVSSLNLEEHVKKTYMLFVAEDSEDGEIKPLLYTAPKTVFSALGELDANMSKKGNSIRGQFVNITRKNGKEYSVTPTFNEVDEETLNNLEIEYDLRDRVYPTTIDDQIEYINNVKRSVMEWGNLTEEEYPFTDDNMIKPEFLPKEQKASV